MSLWIFRFSLSRQQFPIVAPIRKGDEKPAPNKNDPALLDDAD